MQHPFLVGIAEIIITPPKGVDMAGYNRAGPAVGIHDELKAVAVVFDDRSGRKSALCAVDVCSVNPALVQTVRRRAGAKTAIAPERMLIAATHTHSGPALESPRLLNQRWRCELEDRLVQVIQEADLNRRAARIGTAVGAVSGVGGNRRDPAHGPVDRSVTVMRLDDARSGKLLGVIVNHACHATTLDLHNLLISADYPGYLREYVQKHLPGNPKVLFVNGACGNINPGGYSAEDSALGKHIPGRTYEHAQQIGRTLGRETVRLVKSIRAAGGLSVAGGNLTLSLPLRAALLPAEAEAARTEAQRALDQAQRKKIKGRALDRLRLEKMYAAMEADFAKLRFGLPNGEYNTEIQGLCVGNNLLLGMPGELFTELGTAIKKASPFRTTFLIGYSNHGAGYFPTVDALQNGGYEVRTCMFGPSAIQQLEGWAIQLVGGLRRSQAEYARASGQAQPAKPAPDAYLPVLRVPEHNRPRAKFPAIDFHLHCLGTWRTAAQKIAAFKNTNVRYGVSQVGDLFPGAAFEPALGGLTEEDGRLLYFFGLDFRRLDDQDWPDYVRRKMDHDLKLGGRGLKIFKELGLVYRDRSGKLIAPDDQRLQPVWQAAAERGLPVLYHIADPLRSFAPIGKTYEDLRTCRQTDMRWKWGAPGYPAHEDLLRAMDNLAGANPATTFVFPHLASLDHDLRRCGELLRRHANVYVDTSARLLSLGRQPHTARELCLAYADRILWGTDYSWPDEVNYRAWFRLLETNDEYFFQTQFQWKNAGPLYGLGLPDDVLRKIYGVNAARLLRLKNFA